MLASITSLDFSILFWIQEHVRCAFLDMFLPLITHLGDKGWFWIALGAVLLIPRKTRIWGICMLVCLAIDCLLGEGLIKHLFPRQRPCVVQPMEDMLIAIPHSVSFPSGHSASSFTASTALFLNNKHAGIFAYILAALIAFSRLYCYVHFPSDVLCGILLGICVACILTPVLKRHLHNIA